MIFCFSPSFLFSRSIFLIPREASGVGEIGGDGKKRVSTGSVFLRMYDILYEGGRRSCKYFGVS